MRDSVDALLEGVEGEIVTLYDTEMVSHTDTLLFCPPTDEDRQELFDLFTGVGDDSTNTDGAGKAAVRVESWSAIRLWLVRIETLTGMRWLSRIVALRLGQARLWGLQLTSLLICLVRSIILYNIVGSSCTRSLLNSAFQQSKAFLKYIGCSKAVFMDQEAVE